MSAFPDEWWPDPPRPDPLPRCMLRGFLWVTGFGFLALYGALFAGLSVTAFHYVLRG
ncbi:hypothetical protein [Frigoriglobus tundricola]|uniref:Uncharacterized protein n=1 Tax=Frigoriglobus tundricola TaxID=2774151 RepID=A0A6M5YMX3_9BACT|nr:hypothetical protein [Frigoriglobus tundricola]QJW94696.1 hypothetical protein FTUN_2218 [Frigoriglobus tundricola]